MDAEVFRPGMRDFENTDEEDILGDLPGMTARSGEVLGVVEGE